MKKIPDDGGSLSPPVYAGAGAQTLRKSWVSKRKWQFEEQNSVNYVKKIPDDGGSLSPPVCAGAGA